MALKQTDVTVGKRYKVIHNSKLKESIWDNGGAELMVMAADGHYFDGHGDLPIGTEIEIVKEPKNLKGTASRVVLLKIINEPEDNVYSSFWVLFKKRVEEI